MKKLLSFAIVALMMISSVLPVFALGEAPAAPGAANTMNLWVQDATLDVEETTTVEVYVNLSDNTDGFTEMKIVAVYPPCLSLKSMNRGVGSAINGSDFTAGEEKTTVDKILSDFFTEQGMDAGTELGAAGTWKAAGPLLSCDRTDWDDEIEEDVSVDFKGNGKVVRYNFEYDASKNTEGLTEIPIRLYASAFHQNKNSSAPYYGQPANVVCSGGKVTLLNVPDPGEDPGYTEPTISVSEATINEGDAEATFQVKIFKNPGIWGMQSFVIYPASASYKSMTSGDFFSEAAFTLWPETEEDGENLRDLVVSSSFGKYKKLKNILDGKGIAYSGGQKMIVVQNEHTSPSQNVKTENGTLYTLTLNTASVPAGEYDISFVYTPSNTVNKNGEEVTYAIVQGKLTVTGEPACEHPTTENVNVVPATCTEPGSHDVKCTVCEQIIETGVVDPALGHDYVNHDAKEATCTEDGWNAYQTCTRCDYNSKEVIHALGHINGDPVIENEVDPDCVMPGGYDTVVYCTRCTAELSREHTDLDALGHDWKVVSTTGTCGEIGTVNYKCERCGLTKSEEGDIIQHNWVEQSRVEPADCTTDGSIHYKCSICQQEKDEPIPAPGHNLTLHAAVAPPSCTENGNIAYWYCERCHNYFSDADGEHSITQEQTIDPAPGHIAPADYTEENRVEPADCVTDGSYDLVKYCTVCGEELERVPQTIEAPGHQPGDPVEENRVEPTCTEAGSYDLVTYCSVCGAELSRDANKPIAALGHDYQPVVTAPTCTEQGYTTYTCSRQGCGDSYVDDYVPARGHDYQPVVTAPTCTEQGYTTYTCTHDASHTYVDDYVDALGHDLEAGEVVPPKCFEEGYTIYSCKREGCDYTENRDFTPAIGHHDFPTPEENTEQPVPPTCTEEGYTPFICKVCGEEEKRDIVPAKGHEWDEGTVTKEPTVDEEGVKTYHCKNCEETKTEAIPKLVPTPDSGNTSPQTGYKSNGTMTIVFVIAIALITGAAIVVAKKKLFNK